MRLTNSRYEEIKNFIADMLEDYGISTFPVDVDYIAKQMNIVFVYESSHLEDLDGTVIPVDGAVLTDYSKMIHKVFIANWSTYKGKQRYEKHYIDNPIICDWCEMETECEINELI